jgi:hypothetical protein
MCLLAVDGRVPQWLQNATLGTTGSSSAGEISRSAGLFVEDLLSIEIGQNA